MPSCSIRIIPTSSFLRRSMFRDPSTGGRHSGKSRWFPGWLKGTFGFAVPVNGPGGSPHKKGAPWHLQSKATSAPSTWWLQTLGYPPELNNGDDNKYAILCPWHADHSAQGANRTSTIIWQNPDTWPQFKCLHAHCAGKGLKELLEWRRAARKASSTAFASVPAFMNPDSAMTKTGPWFFIPTTGSIVSSHRTRNDYRP